MACKRFTHAIWRFEEFWCGPWGVNSFCRPFHWGENSLCTVGSTWQPIEGQITTIPDTICALYQIATIPDTICALYQITTIPDTICALYQITTMPDAMCLVPVNRHWIPENWSNRCWYYICYDDYSKYSLWGNLVTEHRVDLWPLFTVTILLNTGQYFCIGIYSVTYFSRIPFILYD